MRPTLARLQATLLAAGGALVLGSGLLLSLVLGSADADGVYGAPFAYPGDLLCKEVAAMTMLGLHLLLSLVLGSAHANSLCSVPWVCAGA